MNAVPIIIVVVLIGAVVIANVWTSWKLVRAGDLELGQKVAQACIVWLLPGIGAILVGTMRWVEPATKKEDPGFTEPVNWTNEYVGPSSGSPP